MAGFDYDVLIVGSGFGGSVAALRASEKGYRVGVMESGRRFRDEDIARTQWDLPGFLWFPPAELYGVQRIEYLDDLLVLSGAGVGRGSQVYANTLYVPPRKFFDAPEWSTITDWADELAPCIDQATRMLGAVRYPYQPTDVDRYMRSVAVDMGRGETFNKAPVCVYFGRPGVEAEDPYFGGVGPRRTGCISCGNCNNGCGHNAKNKLTSNYLFRQSGVSLLAKYPYEQSARADGVRANDRFSRYIPNPRRQRRGLRGGYRAVLPCRPETAHRRRQSRRTPLRVR